MWPAVSANRRIRERIDEFLFAAEPAGRVRATRLGLSLLLAVRLAFFPYRGLAGQPSVLFRPVWFLQPLHAMPSARVIVTVQVVGIIAALLAALAWRERWTFLVAFSCLLFDGGLRASRGKIQHNEVMLLLVCVAFLLAPVGMRVLDRKVSRRFGWPIRTGLAVIASVYFVTGFQKIIYSGPAWVLSDNMRNVLYSAPLNGKAPTATVALFLANRAWLTHVLAAGTLLVELGFPAILIWPRCRPYFVTGAVVMHLAIYLTHGLDYSAWALTVVVVLTDWSRVAARLHDRVRGLSSDAGRVLTT
jgi:hypothetical protein